MNFWRYKYFVDVVEQGNFTKAGKINYVSQTAISQQVAALEKEIGGKLLIRGNGNVEVTQLGKIVYRNARNILEAEAHLQKELKRYMNKYVIHIGIDSSINRIVWEIMQRMIDEHYNEDMFTFIAVSGNHAEELMAEGKLDVYIGYKVNSMKSEDIKMKEICRSDTGVYVGRHCDLYNREWVEFTELKNYPRYYANNYSVSKWHLTETDGYCVSNVETMKICTEFNKGYSLVDSRFFSQTEGKILELRGETHHATLRLFYRNDHYLPIFGEITQHVRRLLEEFPEGVAPGQTVR